MKEQPEGIVVCNLECLLMPNGEVICEGKSLGWFKNLKRWLTIKKEG